MPAHLLRGRPAVVATLVAIASFAPAACGGGDDADEGAGNPESKAVDYEQALADAPPPLADLYAQGDALLDGRVDAFESQLEELRGYPAVVNAWASWCGPCRFEFPHFQALAAKRGTEVAFIGVDVEDSEEAARTFLEDFPVPYPSYSDPDRDIWDLLRGVGLPVTAFYSADGELAYTHSGPYSSEADLAADIDRYAR
jgi:thiol-disulfide isomerase/thioredoxin